MAEFICKNCGITFRDKPSRSRQHCTPACRRDFSIKTRTRTCQQCGKKYLIDNIARDHPYCSRECSGLAQRVRVTCICEQCGETFETQPSEVRKYCTHKCFFDACRGQERPIMQGRTPWNARERPARKVLQDLYETQQMTTAEVGELFGVQSQTLRVWLHDCGITVRQDQKAWRLRPGHTLTKRKPIPDKATLEYLYCDWRQTATQIGEHFQASGGTVIKWLKHHDIPRRAAGIGLAARGIQLPTDGELEDMIHVQHLTYREVGNLYGVDQSAVMYWLDRAGVERPKTWHERHNNPQDIAAMQVLYEEGMSLDEIGQMHGVATGGPVKLLFQESGIEIRNGGWHGGIRHETKDGNQVRSTYERRVADWLHENGVEYIYEPRLPFPGLSDFLANGWYIEVWGVDSTSRAGKKYKARMEVKRAEYKAHNLPLIELPAHSFNRQHKGLWKRRLAQCLQPAP